MIKTSRMSSGVHKHRSPVDGEGVSPFYGMGANLWAAVFTFNPYLLISINGIIDINNSFIDINKYGHIIHLY